MLWLLLLGLTSNSIAQVSLPDDTLYLRVDVSSDYRKHAYRKLTDSGDWYPVYRYTLYQPHTIPDVSLFFVSENLRAMDTITQPELSYYPSYTLDSVHSIVFNRAKSAGVTASYFDSLQQIYLIETDERTLGSKATVTEVTFGRRCQDSLYSIHRPRSFYYPLSPLDTALYLLFSDKFYKYDQGTGIDTETMESFPIIHYSLSGNKYDLYDGYPLSFKSENTAYIDTVGLDEISKYPLVTIDQLKQFVTDHYGKQSEDYYGALYFDCLDHIYLVETEPQNGTAAIVEVYLDIGME